MRKKNQKILGDIIKCFFFHDTYVIYNYVRFHRISKYFNSIKSRSVRLIAVE